MLSLSVKPYNQITIVRNGVSIKLMITYVSLEIDSKGVYNLADMSSTFCVAEYQQIVATLLEEFSEFFCTVVVVGHIFFLTRCHKNDIVHCLQAVD